MGASYSSFGYGGNPYEAHASPYVPDTANKLAQAFGQWAAFRRQTAIDKKNADEADVRIAGEKQRQQFAAEDHPLETAFRRAQLYNAGAEPDEQPETASPSASGAVTPAGAMGAGDRMPIHSVMPGAYNPDSGGHNPAYLELGGGLRMPAMLTPRGKQARITGDLTAAGVAPGAADYVAASGDNQLANELLKPTTATATEYKPKTFDEAVRYYLDTHPAEAGRVKTPLTLDQAYKQVDQMYGKWDHGVLTGHALSTAARDRLARRMTSNSFDSSTLPPPPPGYGIPTPRAPAETLPPGQGGFPTNPAPAGSAPAPTGSGPAPAGGDRASSIARARQLMAGYSSLPDSTKRRILGQHGLSDDEVNQVLQTTQN